MITKTHVARCAFFYYICGVGFDFMLPCRFIGFPARVFLFLLFYFVYLLSIRTQRSRLDAIMSGVHFANF